MKFSHLHVHTQYSLLDGAASIPALFKKAVADGQPAIAISDHGNMFGVFDFVKEAYKHLDETGKPKVKPVVGCEFYITTDRKKTAFSRDEKDPRHHQIFLAKNATGYKNLIKLTSLGYKEGMYSKYPRIDKELVVKYSEGLIATSCCLGALIPQTILKKGEAAAENELKWWLNIFQEDYYIELQRHNIPDQDKVNTVLLKFAKKYNLKVIASNDSHYVDQDDFEAHDILLCVNTGEKVTTPANRDFTDDDVALKNTRFAFPNDQFFFKTTAQMQHTFADLPEAIDNTNDVIGKIDLLNLKRDILLPHFKVPDNFKNQNDYLASITWAGANKRYRVLTPEIEQRIQFELGIIEKMDFAGYFLIVADFIRAGRDIGVLVGPGRGSAAGSVVAYCTGITNIDPIKYNLLFERFLNPERKSMPDIDTDFDDEGRQKVIDYVVNKYGQDYVAHIITYGTMAARSAIADVARVMDLPLAESRMLTKLIPERPGVSLNAILNKNLYAKTANPNVDNGFSAEQKYGLNNDELSNVELLRQYEKTHPQYGKVISLAKKLEGSVRNTGIHAAGIIIASQELTDMIPVATHKDAKLWVTQIEGNSIEEAGVIKMDFLGLKTLSVLKTAVQLIKETSGVEVDLDNLPLDDELTYKLFKRGDTNGIFQFESAGMQKYMREIKPDKLEDLIALNALYRPGPMQYIPQYVDRKFGREPITYDLPEMQEILEETYGITVYQEQVMLLSQKLANFTKGQADILRKAMGKKDKATLDKMKASYLAGAKQNGYPEKILNKIWGDWEKFAEYAFNKSHATCYAFVAFQTAYLKAHYPAEFMAALLNHAGSIDKITFFMNECKRMGLTVLGPDVNESQSGFTVNTKGEIRFGFNGMKGVGEAAIEHIVAARKKGGAFASAFDLVKRVNLRAVSKKTLESLVYSGALDGFGLSRGGYFYQHMGEVSNLEKIIKFGQLTQQQSNNQSLTLFGDAGLPEIKPPTLIDNNIWSQMDELNYEKEITGMFLSAHPLEKFRFELEHYNITPINAFLEEKDKPLATINTSPLRLAGLITKVEHRLDKRNNKFGIITIEDYTGNTELLFFGEDYLNFSQFFSKDLLVYMNGSFQQRYRNSNQIEFKVTNVKLLQDLKTLHTEALYLNLYNNTINYNFVQSFIKLFADNKGNTELRFTLFDENKKLETVLTAKERIEITDEVVAYLQANMQNVYLIETS